MSEQNDEVGEVWAFVGISDKLNSDIDFIDEEVVQHDISVVKALS